eukprot:TRINITY_DN18269_c0_g1_i1.p2 TRINITY_DN18269_c0_g1~~TRINITY_DN18269_c0_g1_i1.p2  ORF type:complete len:648 (+),score=152.01 TRINITY_DN18269_c0_g1_i1:3422-5365(+)
MSDDGLSTSSDATSCPPLVDEGRRRSVPGQGVSKEGASGTAHLYVFTAPKGGMDGFDRALQQKVIEELSKGSKHLENAQRLDAKTTARAEAMKVRLAGLGAAELAQSEKTARRVVADIEMERQASGRRWCAVVDMDMFYAAIVIKDNPHLADKPVAVGGMSMLSTSNYVARKYGVRAGMPGFIAKELCVRQGVQLVFMKLSSERRREESKAFFGVLEKYGPVAAMSDDEGRVDLTARVRDMFRQVDATNATGKTEEDCAAEVLAALRHEIYTTTTLTASGCVATNFFLAKIGADKNKPNGQYIAPRAREGILAWLTPLPIRKIPGIGKVTERVLSEGLGMGTVGEVLEGAGRLVAAWGVTGKSTRHILQSCLGVGRDTLRDYSSMPDNAVTRATVGVERTFQRLSDRAEIIAVLQRLCDKVEAALVKNNLAGRCVAVKIKLTSFQTYTRQVNIPTLVDTAAQIFAHSRKLLEKEMDAAPPGGFALRLLGVRVGSFRQHLSRDKASDTSQTRLSSFFVRKTAPLAQADDSTSEDPAISIDSDENLFESEEPASDNAESIVCMSPPRARPAVSISPDASPVDACSDSDVCIVEAAATASVRSPRPRKRQPPPEPPAKVPKKRRRGEPKITAFLNAGSERGAGQDCILLD